MAALLRDHGATVVDADEIAREVVEPGTSGFDAVVAQFGAGMVRPDGSLDRAKLAEVVFADDEARQALNAIVHPRVGERFGELMALAPDGAIVVYDVPLLVEGNLAGGFDVVVVVEAAQQTRIARLSGRGMSAADAQARMATQASDEQRRAVAHEVISNDGSTDELRAQTDELWERLVSRAATAGGSG